MGSSPGAYPGLGHARCLPGLPWRSQQSNADAKGFLFPWRESIDECCSEMKICIEIAQRCINRDPKNRPTIVEIVDQLNETELVTQDATTIINEPRHDPESSQYQVVIKFWEMFSRNIVAPSRVPDFRFRGPDYKPPPVPPTHVAKGKDDDLRLALDDHEGPVVLGNDVRKLIMWLTEDAFDNSRLKIIPIIGPKGMGKSVLAWQVYRHRSVVGRFDCRAWCNVISRTSSWPDVAAQLLDSLETRDNIGLPLWNDDKPVMELKAHLRGRRFLLVLDGLDYQPTLTAMEETLRWCPYTAGSVVVVTTCSESLVLTCDAYSFMHLKTQPSIVDAFMNRALAMVPDMPYSMAVVVRKILSRFSTDPFYMKMLIHLLYVNPSRTTQELQGLSSRLADDEPLTNAMQMFMFSYDELPSHYKSCLLYLTIFPQGCTIRRKSLIRRWVVEGLVSSTTDGLLPALEVADRCFDELLDRGFVIPVDIGAAGKVKTCRLDATVHDSITLFARQENLVDTNYLLPSTLAPRLSISNGITPQHLLKVRQANNNRNVSGWIWRTFSTKKVLSSGNSDIVVLLECLSSSQRLKLITVLDLEGCQGLERRHFKIICNKLYQLKYLCLRRTNVTRLPKDINKLRYLETLDVRETQVQDFGTEPLVLQMLKHLLAGMKKDITMSNTSFSAVYIPQCVGIMRNLQVLCHVEVSHNTELDEISHLQQLRKLGVVLNGKDVDLKHLLGTINELSSCLRSLSIRIKELPPPYWVEGLHMPDPLFKRPPKFLESLSICGLRNELPYWIQELHQLVNNPERNLPDGECFKDPGPTEGLALS
ncbi:hypothetical protein PR202_gb13275 [Eleusine coracana subsp. coracana]|uniref:NB-ARC domain-containing protein n=1 Tax=Eleusine coracana subsp. coracana TaxID=191504 RepID=A0AAV5ESN1_ELECO|nr:hypothetical protein PR202_gb13275 [Eleusine coracana subsp. coracana]